MKTTQTSDILNKKLIAISLILFILVTPISFSIDYFESQRFPSIDRAYTDSRFGSSDLYAGDFAGGTINLGEAIVINVADIEPKAPLKSKFIENSNTPVYVYLSGHTAGSLLFGEGGTEASPFLSTPRIKRAYVTLDPRSREYVVGSPYYIRPNRLDMDLQNMGYLVVLLKKIPNENEVPDEIVLNMSMKVFFDTTSGFGDKSAVDLVLKESTDEEDWEENAPESSFWNRKGYLRLIDAESGRAKVQLYGSGLIPAIPYQDDEFESRGIITLSEGESRILTLPGSSSFFNDRIRIKLNKVTDPKDTASIEVDFGDSEIGRKLTEEERIFPGSNWKIQEGSIERITQNGKFVERVVIENIFGQTQTLTREYKKTSENIGIKTIGEENVRETEREVCSDEYIIDDFYSENAILNEMLVKEKIELASVSGKTMPSQIELITRDARRLYCTSVKEYQKALTGEEEKDNEIYSQIAKAFDKLSEHYEFEDVRLDEESKEVRENILGLSYYYYKKAGKNDDAEEIKEKAIKNVKTNIVWLRDEGVKLSLKSINLVENTESEKSNVKFVVDGKSETRYTNNLPETLFVVRSSGTLSEWKIQDTGNNYVVLRQYIDGRPTNEKIEIRKGEERNIDGKNVKLTDIISNKRAYVTVYPGTGNAYSESSFLVHLPIDKRAIQFNPDEVEDQIEKNEDIIENLNSNIDTLTDLIKNWKNVCLVTWSYLIVKNSFLGNVVERNKARKDIMPVYSEYCKDKIGREEGQYPTYDDCMNDLSSEIESNLDIAENFIETAEECEKAKTIAEKQDKCNLNIENVDKFDKLKQGAGIEYEIPDNVFSDYYKYCVAYQEENLNINIGERYLSEFDVKCEEATAIINEETEATTIALNTLEGVQLNGKSYSTYLTNENQFNTLTYEQQVKVLSQYNHLRTLSLNSELKESYDEDDLKEEAKEEYGVEIKDVLTTVSDQGNGQYVGYIKSGKQFNTIKLSIPKYGDKGIRGSKAYNEKAELECVGRDDTNCIEKIKSNGYLDKLKVSFKEDINIYKSDSNDYYLSLEEFVYSETGERGNYAQNAKLQIDSKGRPYCIPARDGDYYWIKGGDDAWNTLGEPIKGFVYKMNVGPDGELCTEDDVLIEDPEELARDTNEFGKLKSLTRGLKCDPGEDLGIPIAGRSWKCEDRAHREDTKGLETHCQDVMDPSDCRTLFTVCDPVVCPASRFDFGGAYNFGNDESIVQKGIIGSLILGQRNFNKPICLPGVLAGLENIKSVFVDLNECLRTQVASGENTGICDTIRSVGICEILWREAITVFKLRGSLIGVINEKLYGEEARSGGEYLGNLNQKLDAVSENIDYFTKQYATSSFESFRGKSTEEIGGEVCKAAVYGKFSDVGDFVDQLSEPERPPQATGWFSESPWSLQGGQTLDQQGRPRYQQQSEYSVYYHIYAGNVPEFAKTGYTRQGIRYSVYLTNADRSQTLPVISNDPNKYYGILPYEQSADQTIVTYGPSGLDRMCIWLNGREFCGIGKASTSFAVNAAQDLFVEDEALRQDINSMEDCVPEYSRTSPSLGSIALPRKYGATSTGLIRICSVRDPNEATDPGKWKVVGNCGKDEQGHNLGYCWLDKESVSIDNVYKREDVLEQLSIDESKIKASRNAVDEIKIKFFDEANSKTYYDALKTRYEDLSKQDIDKIKKKNELLNLLSGSVQGLVGQTSTGENIVVNFRELSIYSQDAETKLKAQYMVGQIYYDLGNLLNTGNTLVAEEIEKGSKGDITTKEKEDKEEDIITFPISKEYKLKLGESLDLPMKLEGIRVIVSINKININDGSASIGVPGLRESIELKKGESKSIPYNNYNIKYNLNNIDFATNEVDLNIEISKREIETKEISCNDCNEIYGGCKTDKRCNSYDTEKADCYLNYETILWISKKTTCEICPENCRELNLEKECSNCNKCGWSEFRESCSNKNDLEKDYYFGKEIDSNWDVKRIIRNFYSNKESNNDDFIRRFLLYKDNKDSFDDSGRFITGKRITIPLTDEELNSNPNNKRILFIDEDEKTTVAQSEGR